MLNDNDPTFDKVDLNTPAFRRSLVWEKDNGPQECEIEIWMPVEGGHAKWEAPIRITGLGRTLMSAGTGDDPLGALIDALAFARDAVDRKRERVLFGQHEAGGLPLFLGNYRFTPKVAAEVEARAMAMADDAFTDHLSSFFPSAPMS